MKQFIFYILFLISVHNVNGQLLKGKIIDKETQEPLIGANILLLQKSDSTLTVSDVNGLFSFKVSEPIAVLKVSYIGYEPIKIELENVNTEVIISLTLDESNISVNPIIVANPFNSNDVSFNRKEFQVLAGAYEDPARLLLKAPGFSTSNDQANYILYRGFPSNYVNWNINGAGIVNPNHTSNAGSLSDVSSINAGGVNMLSSQVIGKYNFHSAPYGFPFNNSIVGASDIEFTNFNNTYLNLSLVGLEAGYGYSGKKLPAIQVNYRYSFVGILTQVLGLDFGGEKIAYQDLFAKINLIDKETESLTAFVAKGGSFNNHDIIQDIDKNASFKDISDIRFNSDILLSGIKYKKSFADMVFNGVINYSRKKDQRFALTPILSYSSRNELEQQLLSSVLKLDKSWNSANIRFGANINYTDDYINRKLFNFAGKINEFKNLNFTPFISFQQESLNYYFDLGIGSTFNSLTGNFLIEPNAKLIGKIRRDYSVELAYRRNSQLLSSINFSYGIEPRETIADHFEVNFKVNKKRINAFVGAFYHSVNKLLIEENSNYSQFSGVDHPFIQNYNFTGKGRSYGSSIGASIKDLLIHNFDLTANYTAFEAEFTNSKQEWIENTFNFKHSTNILLSYELNLKKDKEILISLSSHIRGGLREFDIDYERSFYAYQVAYDFSGIPNNVLTPYSRIDARILYNIRKGSYRKYAQSLSLDIQNITNRENAAHNTIDFYSGDRYLQNQLGMVPVLAYRIEF